MVYCLQVNLGDHLGAKLAEVPNSHPIPSNRVHQIKDGGNSRTVISTTSTHLPLDRCVIDNPVRDDQIDVVAKGGMEMPILSCHGLHFQLPHTGSTITYANQHEMAAAEMWVEAISKRKANGVADAND